MICKIYSLLTVMAMALCSTLAAEPLPAYESNQWSCPALAESNRSSYPVSAESNQWSCPASVESNRSSYPVSAESNQSSYPVSAESFTYVKLGAGFTRAKSIEKRGEGEIKSKHTKWSYEFGPAIGIGRRFTLDSSAVDLSINWLGNNHAGYFACPKIMYLQYLSPYSSSSLYYGGGLSLGCIASKGLKFSGLQGEVAVGYEMNRHSNIRTFIELNASHGILAFDSKYKNDSFAPAVSLTFGVGF
jgi:hypothetical protein